MKKIILLIAAFAGQICFAGNDGPGGGDVIVCESANDNKSDTYYVLDFYLWKRQNGNKLNSLVSIIEKLKATAPSLGDDLENFVNSSPYPVGIKLSSNWVKKKKIRQINDEELGSYLDKMNKTPRSILLRERLPSHCSLKQAVLRMENSEGITYEYDPSILDMLNNGELQLSYLLIHEWLRNYFSSAEKIRKANWFFHGQPFLTYDSDVMSRALCNYGLQCEQ